MGKMKKIVLMIKPQGAFDRRFLRGIARFTHSHFDWSIFHQSEKKNRNLKIVKNWGAHGAIVDYREFEEVHTAFRNIPIITINSNRSDSKLPNIQSDSDSIAQIAFDHFKERGFKTFAFAGFDDLKWSKDRKSSFEAIVTSNGLSCEFFLSSYINKNWTWDKELKLLVDWVTSLPKPTAILSCSDEHGRHIIEACRNANISIPDEVAIVGIDNDDVICNLCSPTLSSIFLNTEPVGYRAAELLDKLMRGEKMDGQRIIAEPTEVETRGSSDIFLIDDPEMNRVIKYIHENSTRPIDVEEIAEYSCRSRRSLYDSFIKTTGLSPSQYIQNIRIKQISRLLLKTDLSLNHIAHKLGYSGSEKISRVFKKEKGVTPSTYRKKYGNTK